MIVPLRILLIGILLTAPCVAFAQENQSTGDLPTVAELVEQLDSKQREVRQSAAQQLIDRGPAILDQLPEYDAVKSPHLRSALFRIRQELENEKIELSLRGTTFELPDRDLTLVEAVNLIREKTANDLQISESLELPKTQIRLAPVRFEQKEITFWEAVVQLIEKYQLDLEVVDSGGGLVFVPGQGKKTYFISYDIAVKYPDRPIAWRVNKAERKPITGRDDVELLRFEMQLLFEPRLTPLFVKVSGNQLAFEVDQDVEGPAGRTKLLPFSPEAVTEFSCHQRPISPVFHVDWMVPADEEVTTVSVYPEAEAMLAVGRFDFVFQNWDQARTSVRRGFGVVVRDELVITNDEVSFLLILLFSERGAPFESHREWLSQNLIELKSGAQILKPKAPPEKELEADGSVAFRYRFDRPQGNPGDWTLHYRFPTRFRSINWKTAAAIDLTDWPPPSRQKDNP